MLESKHTFFMSCLAAVAATVARVFYLTQTVSQSTGFLDEKMKALGLTLIGFILFCTVLPALCGRLTAGGKTVCPDDAPGCVAAVFSLLSAAGLVFDLWHVPVAFAWQKYLLLPLGFATVLVFAVTGLARLLQFRVPPLVWAVPIAFMIVQVMVIFTAYTSMVLIGEHFLELAELGLVLLFLLQWGKYRNGVGGPHTLAWASCFGFGAGVLCVSSCLSRGVLFLTGQTAYLHAEHPLNVCELPLAVFMIAALLHAYRTVPVRE